MGSQATLSVSSILQLTFLEQEERADETPASESDRAQCFWLLVWNQDLGLSPGSATLSCL
jgi:hypothetical protein